MSLQLYNPFETYHFDDHTCFLSGDDLTGCDEMITVFPEWVLDRFDYREKKFEMMDSVNQTTYGSMTLPCSNRVKYAFDKLDLEIKEAFDKGFEAVNSLESQKLFLWSGRMVYGILYHEMLIEKKRADEQEIKFELSDTLKKRFGYFHLMLQSLISPVHFTQNKAWSISVVQLKYSKDIFNYRDDAINLIFSLGINGFGIIAILQDNGVLYNEYKEILSKTKGHVLHPIQFEELCARFLYSNYLLQYSKEFKITGDGKSITIDALPVVEQGSKPIFRPWKDKTFGQLLHDYWSPWGFTEKEIFGSQSIPVSFLENNYTYELIDPESINLPF
ncbi:MAG: hypothetical protein WBF83_06530 [Moheibacter sp.]